MTSEEKQRLVQEALKRGEAGRASLRDSADRLRAEMEERLLAEGVPASLLIYMRLAQERRFLPSRIARELIQVQSLPDGALPIYDRDPEVAAIVTDDPEAGS